jgi:hypothetical protein
MKKYDFSKNSTSSEMALMRKVLNAHKSELDRENASFRGLILDLLETEGAEGIRIARAFFESLDEESNSNEMVEVFNRDAVEIMLNLMGIDK